MIRKGLRCFFILFKIIIMELYIDKICKKKFMILWILIGKTIETIF